MPAALRWRCHEALRCPVRQENDRPGADRAVVRGDDSDNGDLDLLVHALPGATLLDLGGLQDELES